MRTKQISGEVPLTLEENERAHIEDVLRVCDGNKQRAAHLLDIDRKTLYRKLKQLGIHERAHAFYLRNQPRIEEG